GYNGNDALLASYGFQVGEFMPDRIRIKSQLNKTNYAPGDTLKLSVFAENFFGPPAANRNYEVSAQFSRRDFYIKTYPGFRFYNSDKTSYSTLFRSGKTSDKGTFEENYFLSQTMKGSGIVD